MQFIWVQSAVKPSSSDKSSFAKRRNKWQDTPQNLAFGAQKIYTMLHSPSLNRMSIYLVLIGLNHLENEC